ncbi:MAG TPA: hypothetical protein VGL99_33140, partial [Chloroflexota bacterium]
MTVRVTPRVDTGPREDLHHLPARVGAVEQSPQVPGVSEPWSAAEQDALPAVWPAKAAPLDFLPQVPPAERRQRCEQSE